MSGTQCASPHPLGDDSNPSTQQWADAHLDPQQGCNVKEERLAGSGRHVLGWYEGECKGTCRSQSPKEHSPLRGASVVQVLMVCRTTSAPSWPHSISSSSEYARSPAQAHRHNSRGRLSCVWIIASHKADVSLTQPAPIPSIWYAGGTKVTVQNWKACRQARWGSTLTKTT